MKKNKMMRLASGLLVAVLITTSTISGTFAKYVTEGTATDSARVAKWGVVVEAAGNLYGDKYATSGEITADETEGVVSVWGKQSTTENNVVAPGTQSDAGFSFSVNGTPEVDALVTMSLEHQNIFLGEGDYGVMVASTGVTEENFVTNKYYTEAGGTYTLAAAFDPAESYFELHDAATVGSTGYWPVVYTASGLTLGGTPSTEADSLKLIAEAVMKGAGTQDLTDKSKYTYTEVQTAIEQNKDIATVLGLGNVDIAWSWAFGTAADFGADPVNKNINNSDRADTILGNLMAERIDTENFTTDFKGDVVKSTGTGTYGQPTEGTDFCLDTNFSVEIFVEQVD